MSGAGELDGHLSERLSAGSVAEYAYLTPRGEPLCWPVTPYWYPSRGVLGIATGLAYPNKAYYVRAHPKVGVMVGDVAVQGDAVVLDQDLQANTDRYVREMRAKFLSARIGLNPVSVKLLDFYLPRLWIEITPVRVGVADPGAGVQFAGDPAPSPSPTPGPSPGPVFGLGAGLGAGSPELAALLRWVEREGEAVVTLVGPDGYPAQARTRVARGPQGSVELGHAPGTGPACLTLHTQSLGGVRLDALMARGWVTEGPGDLRFVARRVVGFLGRDPGARPAFGSIFPLSQLPRAGAFRSMLTRELSRRGEPLPRLRVPHLRRGLLPGDR